ncbi:MAG: TonB-dependent receptor [Flavobacteriales bacterium]
MRRIILLLTSIIYSLSLCAQLLKVTDNTNLQPLSDVAIYCNNPTISAITNSKGVADISAFKNTDTIVFSHIGYTIKAYSYSELITMNFTVRLSEKSFSIDEVVISASRFEEKIQDVAQPIQVIKSKELAFMNQQTTAEVMQSSGNVLVQKSQLGGGSPVIRGFETNKVLMVVDGVRMNNAIYRGGHLQNIITLDNSMLDKLEIVFGPGSVMYGSDALGGVMHFYTKNPILSDSTGLTVKSNAFTRYSTAYNEQTGHADISVGGKKFGSLTSFTYSNFGDLRQGNIRNPFYGDFGKRTFYVERINGKDSMLTNDNVNIQKQSGYSQYDILQKFLFKQNEKVSHTINLQYSSSSNVPRYDRLTQLSGTNPKYAEWYYGPQKRMFASYSLSLSNKNAVYDNARIILGYQNVEESRYDRRFNEEILNSRIENVDVFTFNADFEKKLNKHEIRYGLDVWYNQVNSTAKEQNIVTGATASLDTRYPDGGSIMQSIAGYLSHTFEISKKLILTDGFRVNNVLLNSKFIDTTFFPFPFKEVTQQSTALNGNLGLIYLPRLDWRFTLLGSSGFRAPNVDDLSKVFESVPGRVVVPNPNLKPEYTYNIDFGISKTFDTRITVGGTGYYTIYKNAITSSSGKFNGQDSIMYSGQLSQVTTNINAAEAFIYGFNAYLNADITEHFSITNTVNYTFGRLKTDSTDYPLDHISPIFGKTSFNLKLNKFRGEFFILYNGAKKSSDYNLLGEDNEAYSVNPINGYMPSWMTLNIRAAYQFNKYIQLQAALENILDQNYRVFASNISAPGRNLVLTLRGNF